MCKKCSFPDGIEIKPDGIHKLDPCIYIEESVLTNCIVHILRCERCGHVELEFEKTRYTEDITDLV